MSKLKNWITLGDPNSSRICILPGTWGDPNSPVEAPLLLSLSRSLAPHSSHSDLSIRLLRLGLSARPVALAPPPVSPPLPHSTVLYSFSKPRRLLKVGSLLSGRRERKEPMAASSQAFSGNLKKAIAGLRRINLEGLRWRVFDAKGQVLGRLASRIATVLQGKDKPTYAPNREDGDMCIVLNAKDISVTGRKMTHKFYRWHTGYIGHLKERSLKDQMEKDPTEVIRKAVLRMLPRNKLRDDRDRKLRIFAANDHPFNDRPLETFVMPPRNVREMRPRARRALVRSQKKLEQGSTMVNTKRKKEDADASCGQVKNSEVTA